MLMVISPAKKLDMKRTLQGIPATQPDYLDDSALLVQSLQSMDSYALASLMKLSMPLADLNQRRYHDWQRPFSEKNASHALAAFRGDVYQTLQADGFNDQEQFFAQQHLRILSGLYGLLRPYDLMQAYRLEMGTSLATARGRNLYQFWGSMITDALNIQMQHINTPWLINLASQEYFKVIQEKNIAGNIITPLFKEYHRGTYKVIGIHAKRTRGMMARYIIQKKLTQANDIKGFCEGGYAWHKDLSTATTWVFCRRE